MFSNPDFSLFFERAETGMESREVVIEDFFLDIVPLSQDFFFGRGINGTVYSSQIGYDELGNKGAGYREGIENGYLQLILNFGFIYLLCFVILSLIAFFKGFIDSNNLLAKSCGALVFINLVDMIGFGIPELTFRFFLVWLSMTFCLSRNFRKLSDLEIKNLIFQ
jgi:O-antigen ligase